MGPIVLTTEQRKEIERRRKRTLDRRLYQRLTAVLAVAAGHPPEEVSDLLLHPAFLKTQRNSSIQDEGSKQAGLVLEALKGI